MANYYLIQMYYDSGRVSTKLLEERKALAKGYRAGQREAREMYVLYVDSFSTVEAAEKYKVETVGA